MKDIPCYKMSSEWIDGLFNHLENNGLIPEGQTKKVSLYLLGYFNIHVSEALEWWGYK